MICYSSRVPYLVSTSLDATLLRLPYDSPEDYSTSILIIMPSKAHSCSIQQWAQRIKWDSIEREVKKMESELITNSEICLLSFILG